MRRFAIQRVTLLKHLPNLFAQRLAGEVGRRSAQVQPRRLTSVDTGAQINHYANTTVHITSAIPVRIIPPPVATTVEAARYSRAAASRARNPPQPSFNDISDAHLHVHEPAVGILQTENRCLRQRHTDGGFPQPRGQQDKEVFAS